MRTKMPKASKVRPRTKNKKAPEPTIKTRTKKAKMKCHKTTPCGGCTPISHEDEGYCPFYSIGYCGAPCVEMTLCAFSCKKNISCPAYIDAHKAIKDQRRKDLAEREAKKRIAEEEKAPKKKKVKAEEPKKRTRTK